VSKPRLCSAKKSSALFIAIGVFSIVATDSHTVPERMSRAYRPVSREIAVQLAVFYAHLDGRSQRNIETVADKVRGDGRAEATRRRRWRSRRSWRQQQLASRLAASNFEVFASHVDRTCGQVSRSRSRSCIDMSGARVSTPSRRCSAKARRPGSNRMR